jgi:hypothetical protein
MKMFVSSLFMSLYARQRAGFADLKNSRNLFSPRKSRHAALDRFPHPTYSNRPYSRAVSSVG